MEHDRFEQVLVCNARATKPMRWTQGRLTKLLERLLRGSFFPEQGSKGPQACAGRKLGYRLWPWLSRCGSVLVEQSAEMLSASYPVDPNRERDRVWFVVGSAQKHLVALVAASGVVMGDVDVEHVV